MKYFDAGIATVLVAAICVSLGSQSREPGATKPSMRLDVAPDSSQRPGVPTGTVRAAGRIHGRTEEIELRPRLSGQVRQILVTEGQCVSQGDVLISLDTDILAQECDLAAALLESEKAKKTRLENGCLPSELETARQEYLAAGSRLSGAESAHRRAIELAASNAVSQQALDDRSADLKFWQATTAAAKGRHETLRQPPRHEDLLAASAAVQAAEARFRMARTNLAHSDVRAPSDGKILRVNCELGELAGPDSASPLVTLCDTTRLQAVAEIDEFDAMKIQLGQRCEITADGIEGVLGRGRVIRIAPLMGQKQTFGQWAGERSDTLVRRIWIGLEASAQLPVGLPVDVFINANR